MCYKKNIPPFRVKPFCEMRKKEAREYFAWYISEIPVRLRMLEEKLIEEGIVDSLDYSEESLDVIWNWYKTKISFRKMTKEELSRKALLVSDKVVSDKTLMYAMDIAMYLGEVFIHNNAGITWGFFGGGKTVDGVNEPVLLGFSQVKHMNPRQIIEVMTLQYINKKDSDELYDLYNIWKKHV